jgi:hypothetical protein
VVSITPRPRFIPGERTPVPLDRRLGGPQSRSHTQARARSVPRNACQTSGYSLGYFKLKMNNMDPALNCYGIIAESWASFHILILLLLSSAYCVQEERIDASLLGLALRGTYNEVLHMRGEYSPKRKTLDPTCRFPWLRYLCLLPCVSVAAHCSVSMV